MKTYIFLDIDGTLTKDISSWKKVHDEIGSREAAKLNHKQWIVDQDARNWVDNDLKILNGRGVTAKDVDTMLDIEHINYLFGAKSFVYMLQNLIEGLNIAEIHLISGAIYPYAKAVAKDLYIDPSNTHFHHLQYVNRYTAYIRDWKWEHDRTKTFKNKGEVVEQFKGRHNNVIAIGNGINDIDMFKKADIAIGVNIRKEDLKRILPHLDILFTSREGVFPHTLLDYLKGVMSI